MIFCQNLRLTLRHLLKSPVFSALAVIMLALGIGASTAMFSMVESILLRPLPFPQSHQLIALGETLSGIPECHDVTAAGAVDAIHNLKSFSHLGAATKNERAELTGPCPPVMADILRLNSGVLPAFGVNPVMGRFFTAEEEAQRQRVTVLSYDFWKTALHSNPAIIGTRVLLNRQPYDVIGVMPRPFCLFHGRGPNREASCFIPMSFTQEEMQDIGSWGYPMVGRLKPGVTQQQAASEAEALLQGRLKQLPAVIRQMKPKVEIRSLHEAVVADARPLLRLFCWAALTVLLIACANLAGLLLVRAIGRQREMAMRMALGAPKGILIRQSMMESVVLSAVGGLLGLALALLFLHTSTHGLTTLLSGIENVSLRWSVVAFALGLSLGTGFLCGLAPLLTTLKLPLAVTLRESGHQSAGSVGATLRKHLVIGEIAIALTLLVTAGLLLRSFEKQCAVNPGFTQRGVLTARYRLPDSFYASQAAINHFNETLCQQLQDQPGITHVGLTSAVPLAKGYSKSGCTVEGHVSTHPSGFEILQCNETSGNYLQAMGIPLLAGRYLDRQDIESTQPVIVVNKKMADTYWPGTRPLGKRVDISGQWFTVVGVVANVAHQGLDKPMESQLFQPVRQNVLHSNGKTPLPLVGQEMFVVMQGTLSTPQMTSLLQTAVKTLDSQLPLSDIKTMAVRVAQSTSSRRFSTLLVSGFALVALLLTGLGIYSVMAFSTAMRSQEMAIRLALGGTRQSILALVLKSALILALIGGGVGLLGALGLSGVLRAQLFGVTPLDPLVLTLACLGVLMLTLLAALSPALKSAGTDPLQAMKGN